MATKRPGDCPPESTKTPGVWPIDRPGRPSPFGVQWRERVWDPVTKEEREEKRTEFFTSAADRDKRRLRIHADKLAGRATDLPRDEQEEWRAFRAAAAGTDWRVIFGNHQAWLEHTGAPKTTPTISNYRKRYLLELAARVSKDQLSQASYDNEERLLDKFEASFGAFTLQQPSAEQVEKWLDSLGHDSPFTFNSQRKLLFTFFNAARRAALIRFNPIENLRRRRAVVDNRKRIITPQETAQLFIVAMERERFKPMLARLALEAFLGIRFSSAFRLNREDVRPDERTIMLPAAELKTGRESGEGHLINGAPSQVWEWLAIAPESGWALEPRQYLELKSMVFVAAGVRHPPNCLRKSFTTYDLAAHGNAGRTAYLLGHTSQRELWRSYKGNATRAAGHLYQQITPQTCAAIARGEVPHVPDPLRKEPEPQDGSASGSGPAHASSSSG